MRAYNRYTIFELWRYFHIVATGGKFHEYANDDVNVFLNFLVLSKREFRKEIEFARLTRRLSFLRALNVVLGNISINRKVFSITPVVAGVYKVYRHG